MWAGWENVWYTNPLRSCFKLEFWAIRHNIRQGQILLFNCKIKRPQAEYPLEVIIMNKAETPLVYHFDLTITVEYGKGENRQKRNVCIFLYH